LRDGAAPHRSTSSLDTMRTREQYDQAVAICRNAIAQWDPLALLSGGAPADEYDLEVSSLVPKLRDARTASDVARVISKVFGDGFGETSLDPDDCAKVGAAIYLRLRSAGLL
jgi:hypothetical protein